MVRRNENNDRKTEQFRKLFIGGLNLATDESRLKEFYEKWGELVDVVVMKEKRAGGRSRGFGFVTYREPDMVDAAQSDRPHVIDGKTVETKRAMPREDSHNPESHMTVKKLFVGGLKKDVTSQDLSEYFRIYGSNQAEVVTSKDTGESRGFGFVTFEDYDPVDKIILYKPHTIKTSNVEVKKALTREQVNESKRKEYERNRAAPVGGGGGQYGGYDDRYYDGYDDGYYGYTDSYGRMDMGMGYADPRMDPYYMYNAPCPDGDRYGHPQNKGYGPSRGYDNFGSYSSQDRYSGGPVRGGGKTQGHRSAPYRGGSSAGPHGLKR